MSFCDCKRTQTRLSAFFCVHPASARYVLATLAVVFLVDANAPAQNTNENKPAVHLTGVSIKAVDWKNRVAQTELSIAVDNPGPAFKLTDLSYRLKLNDRQAAEGKYDKAIEVPGHSTETFDLPCDVDLSALPGVAWAVIAGGFDVHYELETEFTVPLLSLLRPRLKTSIGGDISLTETVSGWTARIKERIAGK